MDQHRFDWCGQPSFMNRYDTQQLLGYSSLSLSQALSALQTPDFAANSCGIQAFGLREYVRLHNLVQDEKLTFKKFDLVLRHILLNFHVTVGEQSLDLQPFAHGLTNKEGLLHVYNSNSILFKGRWVTPEYLSYRYGIRQSIPAVVGGGLGAW